MNKYKRGFTSRRHPELDSGSSRIFNKGFTLLEVLVVVLIIGVLAAVALPQYKKAILKSRYSALMPITKSLAEANEVYYLERGEYSNAPTELNIQGQEEYPDGTSILMYDENGLSYVRATNSNVPNARYLVYQKNSENFPGTTMCEASDDPAKALCVALGGEEVPGGNSSGEDGWTAYILTGGYGSTDQLLRPKATCGGVKQPEDITASKSGATGTATCVNGQWKYEWTGGKVYNNIEERCNGDIENSCAGSTFSGKWSVCDGFAANACEGSTFSGNSSRCNGYEANTCEDSSFTGYYSSCYGRDVNACADSTFSGKESYCIGRNANACAGSTFSGKESYCQGERAYACAGSTFSGERSYCLGQYDHSCTGTIIQAGAFCAAVYSGSCDGALYGPDPTGTNQGMGSCQDSYGYGYCPTGVPIMGSWNSTNGSFDITGWKGNCCNPAYMVSGECPAGIAICS